MYDELRDRAIANLEKRKKKEKTAQIIGVIFGAFIAFLYGLTFLMNPEDRPYMLIPIGIFALIYCIIYTILLGIPFLPDTSSISDKDIEQEVAKVYRKYKSSEIEDMNEEEEFELQQLERLIDGEDEYV